ncbi:FtsH protease activity modulator HflK [Comamonas sp. NoAH]|uniref:FtsH protease activity modulator HflK n=1 Tax=Comamonas halotolerans TaxID=3041496 RepID=UPI0024E1548A|nr:FtsH protease activity modulator HflK [Comamonas sp. NoAH]
MNFLNRAPRWAVLPERLRGMFNLNDPRWGRGEDNNAGEGEQRPDSDRPAPPPSSPPPSRGQNNQAGQPPDLDELWRDLNRKLSGLFGGKPPQGPRGGNSQPPEMKSAGIGVGVIAGIAVLIWLGTGFFIVQEGQQAVITQFGKYHSTVGAGFNWRVPYPIQNHELVYVSQIRSVDVGRDTIIKSTGLRESAMLTEDENIVEIKFAVQYRLSDARAWLFESKNPDVAVVQAAETAVREVVGKMKMDTALAEERDQIAPRVRDLMQTILDRYKVGVEVVGINMQQGGVRPPEQVQAAFDDVLKAGQERERAKNEAQAYANDVIPRATGTAARLKEEAEAYRERIAAQAEGDAQRFSSLLAEYKKAPQVTRDRLYTEAMQEVYSNVTKVLVDSRQGSNLLYLPLDKIMQSAGAAAPQPAQDAAARAQTSGSTAVPATPVDSRVRDASRSRERESR